MEKVHIVITGRRNTGKSSLINCILGQNLAVVSEVAGTTTDPVKKSYEIPGVASVVLVDTAGIDDEGELGELRIGKTYEVMRQTDAAILVITDNLFGPYEERLIEEYQELELPFLILHNKSDMTPIDAALKQALEEKYAVPVLSFSALCADNSPVIKALSDLIGKREEHSLLKGIVHPGQLVMLVTPIDSEAPTGRLILPQVQLLRDILDNRCMSIVLQPEEIPAYFLRTSLLPDLVITDSQAFAKVNTLMPPQVPLTSFSIILAHHKGNFENYLEGTPYIDRLSDGDRILMLESCSHHSSCEDIGRVKIPTLLKKYTGKQLSFDYVAGLAQIQRPFTDYALIIQCGGCMVTARQLRNRLRPAIAAKVPVSNYGMVIAHTQGIFRRAVKPVID